jgi:Domain of unknown function (DUF4157)
MRIALQRQCACGGTPGRDGECAACKAKRLALQRSSAGHAAAQGPAAPPLVTDVLRAPGRPLEPSVRSGFEAALGHDFGRVRVHTGARAAESATAVGASAYTVGSSIVFGPRRYEPASAEGRRLLAHELTHVRQQEGAPVSRPLRVLDDPDAEAEAERSARAVSQRIPISVQRQFEGPRLLPEARLRPPPPPMFAQPGSIRETYILPAPADVRLEPSTLLEPRERFPHVLDTTLTGPAPFTPVIFLSVPRCIPGVPLTWADFQGRAPGGAFGAFTSVPIREENVQGNVMFRAIFSERASWVRPEVKGAGARATNGCASLVAGCRRSLAGAGAGAFWDRRPDAACPAAVFTPARATTADECDTVVGAACDSDAVADSARLLAHEQGHFDITCKLVGRADDALAAGRPLATVRTWLNTHAQPQNTRYDNQTHHGCDAAQQSAWLASIAGGLQAVPAP